MEDKISVHLSTDHTVECEDTIIGRAGEGNVTRLEITIPEKLLGYSVYLDFETPNGETLRTPKLSVENGVAYYDVVPYLLTFAGEIKLQVIFVTDDEKTWKSTKRKFHIQKSINAVEDIPEKEDFIFEAQKILDEFSREIPQIAEALANDQEFVDNIAKKAVEFEWDGTKLVVTTANGSESVDLKGKDGKDGTSVTITDISESTVSGGDNVVTFSDSKALTVKNGKDGKDGINGTNGTDGKSAYQYAKEGGYAGTEADYKNDSNPDNIKAELEQIEAPMIVSSVAEMTDTTKHYVNQSTGTIWANITGTSTEVTENNEYNASYETGLNLRLSSNDGGHRTGGNGRYTTDYIEITPSSPYTVTLKGLSVPLVTVDNSYYFVYYFDANKNYLGYAGMGTLGHSPASGAFPMSFNIAKYSNFSSAKYVRITLHLSTSTAITTENLNGLVINFAPKNTTNTTTEKTWSDTGITYAPTFKTDLIGVLGEGDVIYLSDNLPSGKTYTLKYPDNNYATIGTITK